MDENSIVRDIGKRVKRTQRGHFLIGFLLAVILYLKRMKVAEFVSAHCKPPAQYHGMDYGEMAVVYCLYILSNCQDHTVYACREWVEEQPILRYIYPHIQSAFFSEDRIGNMLDAISESSDLIMMDLAQHLVTEFEVKLDVIFLDLTNYTYFGDYHGMSLMDYACCPKSHDRKHKALVQEAFCTRDGGILLWQKILAGSTADVDRYVPMVKRFIKIFTQDTMKKAVFVGDCKMGSASNRAFFHQHHVKYICMEHTTNDQTLKLLKNDLENHKDELVDLQIREDDNDEIQPTYKGFLVPFVLEHEKKTYKEHRAVIFSEEYQEKELANLKKSMENCWIRLEEIKRIALKGSTYKNNAAVNVQIEKALAEYGCKGFLNYSVTDITIEVGKVATTRGPRTENTEYRIKTKTVQNVDFSWIQDKIDSFKSLAGYFVLNTNCDTKSTTCADILKIYKDAHKIEYNFHLQKTIIPAVPAHLKTPSRIKGLMTLIAFCAQLYTLCDREMKKNMRKGLAAGEKTKPIYGIYPNNHPSRAPHTDSVFGRLKDIFCFMEIDASSKLDLELYNLTEKHLELLELLGADLSDYDEDSIGKWIRHWMETNYADFVEVMGSLHMTCDSAK